MYKYIVPPSDLNEITKATLTKYLPIAQKRRNKKHCRSGFSQNLTAHIEERKNEKKKHKYLNRVELMIMTKLRGKNMQP